MGDEEDGNNSSAAAILNGNSTQIPQYLLNEDAVAITVPVIFSLIFLVGLIGNGCVISAVLRHKSMWNAPNLFIVNLAIGDVLLILISLPTAGTLYTFQTWPFGLVMCKASYFIKTLSFGVSIFTLTMLSIDRVLVISQTMKLRQKSSVRIGIMVASIWIFSIIVAIPDAISYYVREDYYEDIQRTVQTCLPHPESWNKYFNYKKVHTMVQSVLFFFLPFIIILICYGIMAYIMIKSLHGIPGETPQCLMRRKETHAKRKKLVIIVITLIILFFVCWLPRNVFMLLTFFGNHGGEMTLGVYIFRIAAYCLAFLNCCVNPIALYFLSKSFRSYYIHQLYCGRKKASPSETELVTRQSQAGDSQPTTRQTQRQRYNYTDQTYASVSETTKLEA